MKFSFNKIVTRINMEKFANLIKKSLREFTNDYLFNCQSKNWFEKQVASHNANLFVYCTERESETKSAQQQVRGCSVLLFAHTLDIIIQIA